ncbi:hypothetical protein K2Z83_20395 [Oscillochloris sp. ZM17-4]|uniref:hypothetical protein n=1 Tax=Oscillochloris sp. ZM17-4 TaxID=2866714 RepID=UPI001C72B278|nr:hypothetical protein [Oscillochloris sp. ZM17-4]MBX0330032.1 hypothetical protein [Oscillochloris sp. ZM17-4]
MTTTPTPAPAADEPALIVENASTWIVRIDGQEFSVAADTPEVQIRQTLSLQYPGARDAQITYDNVDIAGQRHKVLVFTKRAGTKGLSAGEDLALLIITVPPVPVAAVRGAGSLLRDLRGTLTFEQLLLAPVDREGLLVFSTHEVDLCMRLCDVPAGPVVVTIDGCTGSDAF